MKNLKLESWNIAIRKGKSGNILNDKTSLFHLIRNDRYSWIADPFLFEKNGRIYIFAERMDFHLGRGVIAYTELNPRTLSIRTWKNIIVEDWHLSFPYIYEEGQDTFIIPESNSSNILFRYKATDFPNKWDREEIYKGKRLADTALFESNGKGYGYTLEHDQRDSELQKALIFTKDKAGINFKMYSDDPRIRRLGGAFFEYGSDLIKVAQDCKEYYGKQLIFSIFKEKEGKFTEDEIDMVSIKKIQIDKQKHFDGIHTYNACCGYEIIDLKSKKFSIVQWFWIVIRKLSMFVRK